MHEISLVKNIISILQDEYPGKIAQMVRIQVTAGLLSNVQPILMQNAFEAVIADRPEFKHTTLEVKLLPILIHCNDCGATTEVRNYCFICVCGKPSKQIIQGEELLISQVEFTDGLLST